MLFKNRNEFSRSIRIAPFENMLFWKCLLLGISIGYLRIKKKIHHPKRGARLEWCHWQRWPSCPQRILCVGLDLRLSCVFCHKGKYWLVFCKWWRKNTTLPSLNPYSPPTCSHDPDRIRSRLLIKQGVSDSAIAYSPIRAGPSGGKEVRLM